MMHFSGAHVTLTFFAKVDIIFMTFWASSMSLATVAISSAYIIRPSLFRLMHAPALALRMSCGALSSKYGSFLAGLSF